MMCEKENEVWVQELKKLKLTVLSKELCGKLGNISEKNKIRIKVDTRMELCAAFVGIKKLSGIIF